MSYFFNIYVCVLLIPQTEGIYKTDGGLPLSEVAAIRSTQDFNTAVQVWSVVELVAMPFSKSQETTLYEEYGDLQCTVMDVDAIMLFLSVREHL